MRVGHISLGLFAAFLLLELTAGQTIYRSSCNEELLRQFSSLEKRVKILEKKTRTSPQGPDCPEGWSHFQSSCYKASISMMNWTAAHKTCMDQGAKLVEIETIKEDQFLKKLVNDSDTRLDFWTGGVYNEVLGKWIWIVSNKSLTYTNWRPGEPNRLSDENGGVEDRMEIHRTYTSYSWNDNNIPSRRYFICEQEY